MDVLLVVRVQHQQQVEGLCRHRVDHVILGRHGEEHVQHVRAVVEVVARVDERLAQHVLEGGGRDRGNLGQDAVREDLAVARVIVVHGVVVERRHRRDHRGHHRHRVRVVVKAVEEPQQRFVEHRVVADRAVELLELAADRQVAVEQQVRRLEEIGFRRELLDRVAPVQQDPVVAVDVGDLALARRRGHEARVEREDPMVLVNAADVDAVRADGPAARLEDGLLTGLGVDQFVFFAAHLVANPMSTLAPRQHGVGQSGLHGSKVCSRSDYSTILSFWPGVGSLSG